MRGALEQQPEDVRGQGRKGKACMGWEHLSRCGIGWNGRGKSLCYMLSVAESRRGAAAELRRGEGWVRLARGAYRFNSKSGKWLNQISRKREYERTERDGGDYQETEMEGRHIDPAFLFHAGDMRTGRRHNRAVRIMVVVQSGQGVAPASR